MGRWAELSEGEQEERSRLSAGTYRRVGHPPARHRDAMKFPTTRLVAFRMAITVERSGSSSAR